MRRLQVVYNSIATRLSCSLNLFYLTNFITNAQKDGGSPINQIKYLIKSKTLEYSSVIIALLISNVTPIRVFSFKL